ncbi:hypothetical protein [Rhizobium leguminosarum]|uniref:hypothetical protein n=1 Tax=Rhizobium leguminosarum TaxID=384 RepID=UPI00036EB2F3|nr:hypothetical protein [Rhizobium leguminosarum]
MSPNARTASRDSFAEFPLARRDNLIHLNIIKNAFGLETSSLVADFLGTSEATITRTRKGEADIAGLAPAVLGQLFPGVSEIALQAQLIECGLRRIHAEKETYINSGNKPPETLCETLLEKIEQGHRVLARLRERYNEMRPARTAAKALERRTDRAAIRSLEGQLYLYEENYSDAAAAFSIGLSHFDLGKLADLGSKTLLVRMMINWWFAQEMAPAKEVGNDNVSSKLTQKDFVVIACDVASITGDSRILINVAEAHAVHQLDAAASERLCDATEILGIAAADLPKYQPVGYKTSLEDILAFETALSLVVQVEARRCAEKAAKSTGRLDIDGKPYGSLPDDATLYLPRF